jgi:hypothetical protein
MIPPGIGLPSLTLPRNVMRMMLWSSVRQPSSLMLDGQATTPISGRPSFTYEQIWARWRS